MTKIQIRVKILVKCNIHFIIFNLNFFFPNSLNSFLHFAIIYLFLNMVHKFHHLNSNSFSLDFIKLFVIVLVNNILQLILHVFVWVQIFKFVLNWRRIKFSIMWAIVMVRIFQIHDIILVVINLKQNSVDKFIVHH